MLLRCCSRYWAVYLPPSCADMALRRLLYLAALEGCLVLYVFYREWMAWLLLLAVVCLPFLSLLLSLPAMFTVKTSLRCPTEVSVGQLVRPQAVCEGFLPAPPVRCKLRVQHSITGEIWVVRLGKTLDTDHCGVLQITPARLWIYDYLGLWRFPCKKKAQQMLTVLPEPVQPEKLPKPHQYTAAGWRPRTGGSFAENHDLRQYRPGDDLRNIHWKLSSKTGKLIYREPVEPVRKCMVLTMALWGTEDVLDRKLGQLLWVTEHLLEAGVTHEVRCQTGRGVELWYVTNRESRQIMLRELLAAPACPAGQAAPEVPGCYRIGGDSHET